MRVRGRQGMTLVELVVGLAVAGMALAAGGAALHSLADHRRRALDAAASVEHAAAVRRRVVEWVAAARLSPDANGPEFRGVAGLRPRGADDELAFVTRTDAAPVQGLVAVRLYVDRDSATPERGLVAELREWRAAGPTRRLELVPAATGMRARYLSAVSEEPVWLPSWISSSILPRAVELRVEAASPDSVPPLLRLPILVSLGAR